MHAHQIVANGIVPPATGDGGSPLIRKIRARPGTSLFLFALFLRLLWLSVFLSNAEELVKFPAIDGAFYHQWAQDILAGKGLAKKVFYAHPLY